MTPSHAPEKPGRRTAEHLVAAEAYRRILAGEAPETLTALAAALADWLRTAHPDVPPLPPGAVETAVRETWDRRHELIGSAL